MIPLLALEAGALAMAGATALLLREAATASTVPRRGAVVLLLAMMGAMLVGLGVYDLQPTAAGVAMALWISGALSAGIALPILGTLVRASPGERTRSGPPGRGFGATIVGAVVVNELLMGATFGAAAGGGAAWPASLGGALAGLVATVGSSWFLLPMACEMAATAALLRRSVSRPVLTVLLLQAGIMAASPPAFRDGPGGTIALLVGSLGMIALVVVVLEDLHLRPVLARAWASYLVRVLAVYALMMVGLFGWLVFRDVTAFALAAIAEMALFFGALVRPADLDAPGATSWLERPAWATAVLSAIFVAEVGMGAALQFALPAPGTTGAFSFQPLAGVPGAVVGAAFANGVTFLTEAVASSWFLGMMGVEMGALVVLKLRESRHLENRVRLALMLGCYGAFVVLFPSVYAGLAGPGGGDASRIPVLGWSMGVGSFPLAPSVFGAVLATYAITGTLVVLFGRRAICSVLCSAATMYQGTTIDAMKGFNRSSPIARKYLSSRFSAAYSITTGAVMVALVGTSLLSYLDSVGAAAVYVGGTDPSVALFVVSFSIVWYVAFVTIPYAGTYSCVTMGYCYTGTLAQAFQKIGFFALRVRSREVCRACTTLDCAKGCPVGLVDMVGHFRREGVFRSTKCCGVGDCVEACPHGNLYISDVRHWLRGRPSPTPHRPPFPVVGLAAVPLPMARGSGTSPDGAGSHG